MTIIHRLCCILLIAAGSVLGADLINLADYFKNCHYTEPADFDKCMLNSLNQLNHFFYTGVPEYDIPPFDPFFASQVETKRTIPFFGSFHLRLTNVTESGWTSSTVTSFKSDLAHNRVTVLQHWSDKRLTGGYTFQASMFQGGVAVRNHGTFNLTLLGFNQETELTRHPDEFDAEGAPLVRVQVRIQDVNDIRLHISNLVFGNRALEFVVDGIINNTWRPFYPLTKPLVNELVSTAFTRIFTRAFRSVPLEKLFPK